MAPSSAVLIWRAYHPVQHSEHYGIMVRSQMRCGMNDKAALRLLEAFSRYYPCGTIWPSLLSFSAVDF
jgi:hypothetical protein